MFCESYLQALTEGVDGARDVLPDITRAAEAAVPRLLDGGDLYIASTRPDFVSEGFIRSGGMMLLREYDPASPPSSRDVVIAGWSDTDSESKHELLSRLRGTGSVEIIAGTDEAIAGGPVADYIIHPCWPYTDSLVGVPGYDVCILPSSGILQSAVYWSVIGEVTESRMAMGSAR